jgi:Flp pilus assembly protein CpaB
MPAAVARVTAPRAWWYGRLGIWALVCAPVAAILVVVGTRTPRPGTNPVPAPETARVLVAVHDIPAGTAITAENLHALFQWADVPPEAVSPETVGEPTRLIGTETLQTLKAGEPVAESDLWAGLPDGFMLVSLRGDVSDGFGSGYTRGTKIDVWLTPHGKVHPGPDERVLSGVFVIPSSMTDRLREDPSEPDRGVSVCLAMRPEQAKQLAVDEVRGKLRIVPTKQKR